MSFGTIITAIWDNCYIIYVYYSLKSLCISLRLVNNTFTLRKQYIYDSLTIYL